MVLNTKIKKIISGIFLAAPFFVPSAASGTTYPERSLNLVVPFSAGASTDALGRLVGQAVSEQLKQPVVVENRAGGGGVIAADYVRRQKPDGYTFMLSTDGILSVSPSIHRALPYEPQKDFDSLTIAAIAPVVLIVRTDSPFKNVQDIIEAARKAAPGALTFGSSGVGTSQHIAGELFNDLADVKITHVPYKGGAPALNDLLGGHISMMFGQIPSAKELADAGKIRILAIGSPRRSPMLPDVATLDELGLKGYDSDTWYGFSMPHGADPQVKKTLSGAIIKSLKDNASRLEEMGYVVLASTPNEMEETIVTNTEKWKQLLQKSGLYQQQ